MTTWCYLKRKHQQLNRLYDYMKQAQHDVLLPSLSDYEEGLMSLLQDELYKIMSKLVLTKEQVEDEKNKLTDAISDISHQLKTPLTSMSLMIDLLDIESLDEHDKTLYCQQLRQSVDRLIWLVHSLLKLSKLESKTIQFEKKPIKLSDLVQASMELLEIQAREKQIELIVNTTPIMINGDFNWMLEAVSNVLKNAIEQTPRGGMITMSMNQTQTYVELSIHNTGSYIEKDELSHIFNRFYRGKHSSANSLGIGLSLAKVIMTSQAGDVTARSSKAKGTTFDFKFLRELD